MRSSLEALKAHGIGALVTAFERPLNKGIVAQAEMGYLFLEVWDFQAPNIPNEPRDSSASAATASGLIELASFLGDPVERAYYRGAAVAILDSLMSSAYLSDGVESAGILLHGTANKPINAEVDVTLIYGDYYFTEALLRYVATTPATVPGLSPTALASVTLLLLAAGGAMARRSPQ